jgi:hypothetical protein
MFFGSPLFDLQITIFLLGASLIISFVVLVVTKKIFPAIMIFSVLGNIVFLLASFTGSELFRFYSIEWLELFSVLVWPILNVFLIYKLIKSKK